MELSRTPSSILRKRADKENEGQTREGKRAKLPSRRVSFAPDEELSTMHLYQKVKNEDQVQVTEDLAARMPCGLVPTSSPFPLQETTNFNTSAHAAALTPHNNQLIQLDGATGDLFSPLSMDLTNNSFEFHRHQQPIADRSPLVMPPQPPPPPFVPISHTHQAPQPPQPPPPSEYTRNITSAIPALSTLVEEDEEGCHEGGSALRTDSRVHRHGEDMDLSMFSTERVGQEHRPYDLESPALGGAIERDVGQEDRVPQSPSSPFFCSKMGLNMEEEEHDGSGCLKSKWGFTPGADDTLDVSHGRQLMGENTYNHVYGNGTTGDITKAFKSNQGPLNAIALRVQQANTAGAPRQSVSMAALPQPHSPSPVGQGQAEGDDGTDGATGSRGSVQEEQGRQGEKAGELFELVAPTLHHPGSSPLPLPHIHEGAASTSARRRSSMGFGGRPCMGQPEVTINLLADDSNPVDAWRLPPQKTSFMGQPGGTGPTVGNASQQQTAPPPPAAPRSADAMNNTTALLGGITTHNVQHAPNARHHPAQVTGPTHPLGGAGLGGSGGAPTATGFTMQLLADGNSTRGGGLPGNNSTSSSEQLLHQLHAQVPVAVPTSALKPPRPPSAVKQPPSAVKQPLSAFEMPAQTPGQLFGNAPNHTTGNTWGLAAGSSSHERNHEHLTSGSFVAAAAALPLPPDNDGQGMSDGVGGNNVPSITFQDFLGIVEVRFLDDMRRRTSLMQPYDGSALLCMAVEVKPQSLAEGVEMLHVRGVRACLQQRTINELSERVEALQMRLTNREASLARENPPVFQYVQMAEPAELDRLRDQVKLLKRACRHRTMINWKQERIMQEQAISSGFRSSFTALESEAKYMAGVLEEATSIESQLNAMHKAVLRFVQQDQTHTKAAQLNKERLAYQQQRIAVVAAANDARQQKLEGIKEQRRLMQERFDAAMQEKATLQASLQGLQDQGFQQGTPTKSARKAQGNSLATAAHLQQLTRRQEALDVLVGLQGINLDVCSLRSSNTWSMTVHNRFAVSVDMSGSLSGEPRTCAVKVEVLAGAFQGSELARKLLPGVESLFARTIPDVPVHKLAQTMDQLLHQFGCVTQNLAQLEAVHLRVPYFGRVEVLPAKDGDGASNPELLIWFLSADEPIKYVKLGVSLPLSSLMGGLPFNAPVLKARVLVPQLDADLQSAYATQVLGRIAPSHTYLHQLCSTASQLVASGLPTEAQAAARLHEQGSSKEGWLCGAWVNPIPAHRMLDNPLFT